MRLARILNLIALPIVVCVFLFMFINNYNRTTGILVFESETLDFGEIPTWQNETITKSIQCRNIGRKKLVIRRVHSNCGCYSVIQYPHQLVPGELGTFTITADPPKAKPEASIHIVTDSLQKPHVYFSISAVITPYAEFYPSVCDFGEIYTNTVHQKSVRLHINAPFDSEAVQLAPNPSDAISGKLESGNSSEFELKIQAGPMDNEGFFSTNFTIILPDSRTISLPVTARVVGRVWVNPEVLSYGRVTKTESSVADFTLQSETPFKILKVDAPNALSVGILTPSDTPQTSLTARVRLYPEKVQDILRGEIQVFTSLEQYPIRIPVYAAIED